MTIAAGLVTIIASIPLVYIFIRASSASAEAWERLLHARLWQVAGNTLLLTLVATSGALLIGVGMAWLTERTDLPGRNILRWLLALPLAIPAYIGSIVHLSLLRERGGVLPQLLESIFGTYAPTLPSPLGFWGAVFILSLFTYPYVYLLSGAGFRSLPASLEEAGRVFGLTAWQTTWKVTLPALRPALTAGALLVALDILAEYGVVALLRYETFSSAIFVQLAGRYDRSAASILSGVLVSMAIFLLWAEIRLQGQRGFSQVDSSWRPAQRVQLGQWSLPGFLLVLAVVSTSLLVPLGSLAFWSTRALLDPTSLASIIRSGSQNFGHYAWNSLWSSALAAILAMALSLPVAILAVRHPSWISRLMAQLCQVGYAIPGVVIALSMTLMVNRFLPWMYGTPLIVVLAYVLRHMPQAVRASQSTLQHLAPSMEEAARTLGLNSFQALRKVTLPLIWHGVLSGGALVFLTSIKELPATLLLRPAGFDTLAVRVWIWAEDGFYVHAAPAALLITIVSLFPLFFLLRKEKIFQ